MRFLNRVFLYAIMLLKELFFVLVHIVEAIVNKTYFLFLVNNVYL